MFDYLSSTMLIIIIILPVAAAWVFIDAKNKGKRTSEAVWWAVGAFFLSVIIVPAWLWSRPNFEAEKEFLCPECNEIYQGKSIACPNCGYLLVDDQIVDLSSPEPADESGENKETPDDNIEAS